MQKSETVINDAAIVSIMPASADKIKHVAQNAVFVDGVLHHPGETVEVTQKIADHLGSAVKPA